MICQKFYWRPPILTKEDAFKAAMLNTYEEAAKLGYRATYFKRMIAQHGAVEAANQLASAPRISEGLTRLVELGRVDLSVEALVNRPEFSELFADDVREVARQKLSEVGYTPTQ